MTIKSKMGNLGDNLWLTPLFKHGIVNKIILPDDNRCREVGRIFEGLGDVEFLNGNEHCPESPDKIHRAAAHLKYFGSTASCIPYVKLTDKEIARGKEIIANVKNPIIVNFTTFNAGGDWCSARRVMNIDQINYLVENLIKKGFTPINLGLSQNTSQINGVLNILDLNIREVAACHYVVGKYIGTESGPPHLMLAVGGKILVYHPDPDDISYPSWKYHFTEEYWTGEMCRAKYVNFNDLSKIDSDLSFLY